MKNNDGYREAWGDTKLTGLGTTATNWVDTTDPVWKLVSPRFTLESDFPEDPPVGTQIFQYCDSVNRPVYVKRSVRPFNNYRYDPAGQPYDWKESPYIKARYGETD